MLVTILPRIGDPDPSIDRRLLVLKLERTLADDEVIPNFLAECWAEAPGIINRLAEAAGRLAQRGSYVLPPDQEELTLRMQYSDPADHVARLWIEAVPGERVQGRQLQRALRLMARRLGIGTEGVDFRNGHEVAVWPSGQSLWRRPS